MSSWIPLIDYAGRIALCKYILVCRPLVGCMVALPKVAGKQTNFPGHLSMDKIKLQMQREMVRSLFLQGGGGISLYPCSCHVQCWGFLCRGKHCQLHIVLSLTQLSMTWPWSGVCYSHGLPSHGMLYTRFWSSLIYWIIDI